MRTLKLADSTHRAWLRSLREESPVDVADVVRGILADVRTGGDAAVRAHTARLDRADVDPLVVPRALLEAWAAAADPALRAIMERSADNIRAFHAPQRPRPFSLAGGRLVERIVPLDAVGCYVPGGRASYPSTVLMNVIPAKVAGVQRIVVTTPPRPDGTIAPAIALACLIAGADEVVRAGGAQAVGALAYGTETIAPVDSITGPGNAWVAEAKRQVSDRVGVDLHAGPSEVLVLDDGRGDVGRICRDLVAQAEHDVVAIAICVTTSRATWEALPAAMDALLAAEPNPVAAESLASRGAVVLADSLDEAIRFVNAFAPEHLELETDPSVVDRITAAGAIFVGGWSPEPVGDYHAGPNHTLPTGGFARFQSALGTAHFVRKIHVIAHDAAWLAREGPAVAAFARAEGLVGHARAVEVRLDAARAAASSSPVDAARYALPEVRAQKAYTLEAPPDAPSKLNQNEAPEDLPAVLKERILGRARELDWRRYPPFDDVDLRAAIAARDGWVPEGVLLGNGSNELLSTLFAACVGYGERVAIPHPCFSLYPLHLAARGADIVRIPLREADDFRYDLDDVVVAARGAKIALLTSPNNPTGSVLTAADVRHVLDSTDALVVVDEAYREWCGQDFAPLLAHGRLVLMRTFSKALAMAGLRFGYMLGPPGLCREVHKLLLPYNVNAFTRAAVEVLLPEEAMLAERVRFVVAERGRMAAALRARGRRVVEGGANFLLFASADPPAEFRRLLAAGVLVRDLSSGVPGFLRVSVGSPEDNARFLGAV
ncbi:MAG: hypothetical protein RLZZ299_2323 [Pseudomonadota bacterium]